MPGKIVRLLIMSGEYKTIVGIATAKHVVKNSRFIAEVTAIRNRAEANLFITDVQARHRKATHYCYAYKLGIGDETVEYASDASEPKNSAGPPILAAIRKKGLSNTIIVVARYYGGINLGIGGLVRAYGTCARTCLENATVKTILIFNNLKINTSYHQIGRVITLCKRIGGKINSIEYDPNPLINIQIQTNELETFQAQLQSIGVTINEIQ